MRIKYRLYNIRKFFLFFLPITYQVSIIRASSEEIEKSFQKIMIEQESGKIIQELTTLLQENEKNSKINYKNDTFINTVTSNDGKTALQLAFSKLNKVEGILLIKELLKFEQIDTNQAIIDTEKRVKNHMTPLMYAIYLLGKKDETFLDTAIQINSYTNESLRSEIIPPLINHPNTDLNTKDKNGATALIYAIVRGELGIVKSLLGKKKNEKIVVNVNQKFSLKLDKHNYNALYDETALMCAINLFGDGHTHTHPLLKKELKGIIDLLIDYSDLTVVDKNNSTALIIAFDKLYYRLQNKPHIGLKNKVNKFVVKSLTQIIPKLLSPRNVNIQGTFDERTPLMFAIMTKQKALVDSLLSTNDINIDLEDKYGETALFYAITCYDKDIFEQVLHATQQLNHKNKEGQTPLLKLINQKFDNQKNHQEAIQKLAEKLEKKGQVDYRPNNSAFTALQHLVFTYINELKKIENIKINKSKQGNEPTKQINDIKQETKSEQQNLHEQYLPKINILVDAGADPTLTFKDSDDNGTEKTAISLITDELVKEHEELGSLKSSLEEAKKNNKKVKDNNKDPQTKDQDTPIRDQDPSQNQDEGNGMNIGTVVIIIAAVGSLVVGAIVAVPLLFKKKKATKEDNDQSKDNNRKTKAN